MSHLKTVEIESDSDDKIELSSFLSISKFEKGAEFYNFVVNAHYNENVYARLSYYFQNMEKYDEGSKVAVHFSTTGKGSSTGVASNILEDGSSYFDDSLVAINAINKYAKEISVRLDKYKSNMSSRSDMFPRDEDALIKFIKEIL